MWQKICKIMKKFLTFVLAVLITAVVFAIFPIAFTLATPFYIFRFFLIQYVRNYRPDLGKILTTRSAVFITDDMYRKPKANIVLVGSVSGKFEVGKFRKDCMDTIVLTKKENGELAFPEFQQNITSVCGFPFFKWDKPFKIEDHIFEHEDKDASLTPDLVNQLCTKYLKTPLPPGHSPWKLFLFSKCKLNGEDGGEENRTGVIIVLHHSLADGFSILKVTSTAMHPGEEAMKIKAPDKLRRARWEKIYFFLAFLIKAPYEFVLGFIDAFDVNECHISENKLSENVFLAFSQRIPLEYLKAVKQSHGVSLTAVLLAGFTGAVRSFMLENGLKVPKVFHSVTPFPMPGHSEKLRNFMTTCYIRLPVGLSTAEERLMAIEEHLATLKRSTQPISMFYVLMLMGALPTFLVKLLFKQYGPTALISNFPGPQEQIRLLGLPLEDVMFTAGLMPGRIGIGFDALSYNGSVRIQAAFNEALATSDLSSTYMLDKVLSEIQMLADKHIS